jgi:Uma2 family endonuclease
MVRRASCYLSPVLASYDIMERSLSSCKTREEVMALAQPAYAKHKKVTEEQFLRLPADGHKYELVEGEVREVPTSVRHDQIVIRLARLLGPFADEVGILVGSQAGFRMKNGNIRCPDLSLTCYERLPGGEVPEGFGDFAPDFCIEIISPTEERADMERKLEEYFASGARLVWHLFPEKQTIRAYSSPTDFTEYSPEDEIRVDDLLPGFHSGVADLFAISKR